MKRINAFFILLLIISASLSAQITSGKITFERKTNLYKKMKGDNVKNWIKEADKIKVDYFELYFNDTCSAFKPQESELKENFGWATQKNTVYQNFNTAQRYTIKDMWGEQIYLRDSLRPRVWHITESSRKIAGYNCRKAVWRANDSTRIYAWFSYDLSTSTGPESFYGLPGVILGLATEDGGVVYFAKKVEFIKAEAVQMIPPKKKKVFTLSELKADMEKRFGKEKWFKEEWNSQFGIW
jgi:GLPGLI family protein